MLNLRKVNIALIIFVFIILPVVAIGSSNANSAVEATDYNKVVARIYNASTLTPIASANISIYQDGMFPESAKKSCKHRSRRLLYVRWDERPYFEALT